MKTRIKLNVLIVLIFMFTPVLALALAPFQLTAATECTLRNKDDQKRLELVDGAWKFKGRETGTAIMECAIHPLALGVGSIGGFVVFFQDSDGAATATSAKVTLRKRTFPGGVVSIGSYITDEAATTDETAGFEPVSEVVGGELWYYRVELKRAAKEQQINFFAILALDNE